ncbi:FAD-dependent oxidoreductase [Desulfovibrio aerotolerans]|uniref:FAD-dependent oxidoreductase n=1 Tax=Solidesulfovibrio aerotolerans TaxID=295255 RepID=A0A7C9IV04_9BACT|nr:FAD-dependent oxidoreductase [Solidesulfovibrio aerotolerans]MYL82142.1 FAD-dependent oxidoreductase [Solidesulfovibrio aerotolerans]
MDARDRLPVLVAGGGLAGLRAALDLAVAGQEVLLIEAGTRLGGGAAHLAALVQTGQPVQALVAELAQAVAAHPRLTVRFGCRLESVTGAPGELCAVLGQTGEGSTEQIRVAAVILATGCSPFQPGGLDFLAYGVVPDVVTSLSVETMLAADGGVVRPSDGCPPRSVAFIQCVGSRMHQPEERPACSAVCCAVSVRQALALPQARRTLYAMDLRAHVAGTQEALNQAEAQGLTVRYARPHTLAAGPDGRGVTFRFIDQQGTECQDAVDMAVLAVGIGLSAANRAMLDASGVELGRGGFVATDPYAPVATSRPGVFVAGTLGGPGEASLASVQGSAAALEALAAVRVSPPPREPLPVLVLGGGAAGLACSLGLAGCGQRVTLVEASARLGGHPRKHPTVWKGRETKEAVAQMAEAVQSLPGITVMTDARLIAAAQTPQGWTGSLATPLGTQEIAFGAAVLALGSGEARPDEYLLGRDPRVMTQLEFENWRRTHPEPDDTPQTVVFIQCVGSRQRHGFTACARVCCAQALCAAVELKKSRPGAQVAVFYRDITTPGESEDLYTEARRLGVLFFRYDPERAPRVERLGADLAVTGEDILLGRSVRLRPDRLVLAVPVVPVGLAETAALFALPTTGPGFLAPVHPVLLPVDLPRPGLFAAGLCLGPKPLDESVAEAQAAAMRAIVYLAGRS